jgi:ribosomal protein L16/L10AE
MTYLKPHRIFLKRYFASQWCQQRSRRRGVPADFYLSSIQPLLLQPKHFETIRRLLLRALAKSFRYWIVIKPQQMVTAKPREIRMGKGKGEVAFLQAIFYAGQLCLGFTARGSFSSFVLINALRRLQYKLGRICYVHHY